MREATEYVADARDCQRLCIQFQTQIVNATIVAACRTLRRAAGVADSLSDPSAAAAKETSCIFNGYLVEN